MLSHYTSSRSIECFLLKCVPLKSNITYTLFRFDDFWNSWFIPLWQPRTGSLLLSGVLLGLLNPGKGSPTWSCSMAEQVAEAQLVFQLPISVLISKPTLIFPWKQLLTVPEPHGDADGTYQWQETGGSQSSYSKKSSDDYVVTIILALCR